MRSDYRHATATVGAAVALALPASLTIAAAQAAPLPEFCVPPNVIDNVCTARLTSVTADAVDGTITGLPVGGGSAITVSGQGDAYQLSAGFGDARPEPVQRWDETIGTVKGLAVDPADSGWYGNAKAKAFLPRTLNDLASQFPPEILLVRFTPDDAQPGAFRLVSIQPTP